MAPGCSPDPGGVVVHNSFFDSTQQLDDIAINLPPGVTLGTKLLIATFLFAVALDARPSDFAAAIRRPAVFAAGLLTQFVVIPALSLVLISILDVPASVALGLLLVVCLPAGNLSNILTYRARGDLGLSVSLTAISNVGAVILTPVALTFWASLSPQVSDRLAQIDLSPREVLVEVVLLIALPFVLGALVAHWRPEIARKARRFVEPAVVVLLSVLIVGGLAGNASVLVDHVRLLGLAVVGQNALSLLAGYAVAVGCRLPPAGRRAMTLEMGIRNTALGLVLALTFFRSAGGVAVTVAVWGLWDVITGFVLASWWRRRASTAPESVPRERESSRQQQP
jgi:bile acid:Na+ symporter, BASS family